MAKLLTGTRIYGTGTVDTQLFVSGTNSATSTTTGALQVVGGVGVGGNLHVGGIIYGAILGTATTATNADNIKTVSQTTNASYYPAFVDSNNSTAAYEALYTTSSFVINPQSGNVGVGESDPLRKFVVRSDSSGAITAIGIYNGSTATSNGSVISFRSDTTGTGATTFQEFAGFSTTYTDKNHATRSGDFNIFTANSGTVATRLIVKSTGNVGIGNANPSAFTGFTSNRTVLQITNPTSDSGQIILGGGVNALLLDYDNAAGNVTIRNTYGASAAGALINIDSGTLVFRTGTSYTERLRVTANGGISFGASGTAYGVSGQILQSNGDAAPTWISTGSLAAANATTATHLSGGVAGQIPYQTAPGVTAFLSTGTAGDVLVSNGSSAATYNNTLRLAGATNATSTSSGALQVVGGVGVGGDLFIHGDIRTNDTLFNLINGNAITVNFAGDATTLTMGASGSGTTNVRNNLTVNGNLTVQGTTTIVDSTVTNIADPIITLGGGTGNTAPTADDNKDRGVAFKWVNDGGTTSTGFFGYDDSTGHFTYVQTATITNEVVSGTKGAMDVNLAGGTAMSIHYQSAADTTAFLAAGSSGYLLQTNGTGSAPTWVSASGVSAGSATNADNIRTILQTGNTSYYPTFVDSNNASAAYESLYTTSSFSINPQSGLVTISGLTVSASSGAGGISVGSNADRAQYQYINFGGGAGGADYAWQIGRSPNGGVGPADGFYIYDLKGLSTRVSIDGSGNVGIGTITPRVKLAIDAGSVAGVSELVNLHNQSTVSGHGTSLTFSGYNTTSSYPTWRFAGIRGMYDTASAGANAAGWGGQLRFFVNRGATADDFEDVLNITTGGNVGIGTTATLAKLHVSASQDNSILRKEVLRVERVGGAAALAGAGRTSEIAFADASNPTLTASIGGLREAPDGNFNGSLVFYTSITGGAVASAVTSLTERLRITSSGAIAFSGSASYGSSGQVLQSNGNAAPTWVAQSTIAAGSAPLTSTYVGFGSGSNLLTGSSSLTWNGTTLYVNGRIQNPSYTTYNVTTIQQGNVNSTYEIMRIGRDSANWSHNIGYEVTVRSAYYSGGGATKWYITYGYGDAGAISCMDARGGTKHRVYLGTEVTVSGNIKYIPVYVDIPNYYTVAIEVKYSTTEVTTFTGANQVYFTGTMAVGTGAHYGGDTHLVPNGGNVGIGQSSPTAKLSILNTNATYSLSQNIFNASAGNFWIGQSPAATFLSVDNFAMAFCTNSNGGVAGTSIPTNERMRITSDGNVILGYNIATSVSVIKTFATAHAAGNRGGEVRFGLDDGSFAGMVVPNVTSSNPSYNSQHIQFYTHQGAVSSGERMRITASGGISFGASGTAYGTSGQILKSNGDAAPTWVDQSTIAAGSAPLTSTYVGFGSGSNLLTGSANLTYASSILNVAYQNTFNTTTPGTGQYGIHLNGQTTADSATGITFSAGGAGSGNAHAGIYSQGSGSYGTKMYFATTDSYAAGAKTRMMIDHAGNVGINSTAPASKLTVEGSGTANESVARFNNQGDYASRIWLRQSSRSAYLSVSGSTGDTLATGSLPYGLLIGLSGNPSPVQFYNGTSGSVKMTIDTVGNVGIGTTTPTAKFEVAGTAGQLFSVSDSFTGTIFSVNDVSGIPSIEVIDTGLVKFAQYGGQVAINTGTVASSTASLSVYGMIQTMGTLGEIRASSEITAYFSSDRRLKENIKLIENPITIIDQIRGVTFDWTDEHMARRGGEDGYFVRKHDIGVIAQEVQAVLPELVGTREDGYLAVKYEKMVPLLIEAIKSQQKTIDTLTSEIKEIKEFLSSLKNN